MYIIKDYDGNIFGIYNSYEEAISNLPKGLYCEQYGAMVLYCIDFYDTDNDEKQYQEAVEYCEFHDRQKELYDALHVPEGKKVELK